jgi:hypothetical protein
VSPEPTRDLLLRQVLHLRQDIARIKRLAADLGVVEPTPPEVTEALGTLTRWTADLVASGAPRRPETNSGP